MSNESKYQLSGILYSHESDARHIAICENGKFISSSRDCTAKIWRCDSPGNYVLEKTLKGHEQTRNRGGIACSHYIPPKTTGFENGAIVTGGYDKVAYIWDLDTDGDKPTQVLRGENGAVLCIDHHSDGRIALGYDSNKIVVWKDGNVVQTLIGHKYPVWAVLFKKQYIISASGDRTIKIWENGTCIKTIVAHEESVRSLLDFELFGFASCSNDNRIKIWSDDGDLISELNDHSSSVFSMAVCPNGNWISGSEDGTVKIWCQENCIQTLVQPSCVWSVGCLANGDIVSACENGSLYVWSKDPDAHCSLVEIEANNKAYNDYIAALMTQSSMQKSRIGDKEYDVVVDVDLGDGVPPIKLGFNNNDDPYQVAQNFIIQHELPQDYLDTIAQFIIKNSKSRTIEPEFKGVLDPLTSRESFTDTSEPASKYFPQQTLFLYGTGKPDAILSKLTELNNKITEEEPMKAIPDQEFLKIQAMILKLKSNDKSLIFCSEEVDLLFRYTRNWPIDKVYPLLDLIRFGLSFEDFGNYLPDDFLAILLKTFTETIPVNQRLSLACLSNCLKWEKLRLNILENYETILQLLARLKSATSKTLKDTLAIFILNISLYLHTLPDNRELVNASLIFCSEMLHIVEENDLIMRYLVALGTFVFNNTINIKIQGIPELESTLELVSRREDKDVKNCALDLIKAIKTIKKFLH